MTPSCWRRQLREGGLASAGCAHACARPQLAVQTRCTDASGRWATDITVDAGSRDGGTSRDLLFALRYPLQSFSPPSSGQIGLQVYLPFTALTSIVFNLRAAQRRRSAAQLRRVIGSFLTSYIFFTEVKRGWIRAVSPPPNLCRRSFDITCTQPELPRGMRRLGRR